MSQGHRTAVEAILQRAEVTFSAICLGERVRDDWKCDAWSVSFKKREGNAVPVQDFDFYTGVGLRKPSAVPTNFPAPRNAKHRWEKQVAPHPADVLHSIVLDSNAAEQTFATWCDEYGYNTDSRKAMDTYEACQRNTDKLRRVFTREEIAALSEALQDY